MIYYGKQSISEEDIEAVIEVLRSDFLTQGPAGPMFEKALTHYTDAQYCTAVSSATAALHLLMVALGIGPGDEVWTTPITFAASANCARYVGADVRFVDICEATLNLCPVKLKEKLSSCSSNKLPKALVVVHFCGNPANMAEIQSLCEEFGIKIIEDASHALGACINGEKVGGCAYSDAAVFSFHPVKMITSGEGGAITTNSAELDKRLKLLRSHGITRDHVNEKYKKSPWYYEQIELGFNYRLSDIQSALGISQLTRIDEFLEKRQNKATLYKEKIFNKNIKFQIIQKGAFSSYHLFVVQFDNSEIRNIIYQKLSSIGVTCNLHYIPVYRLPYYEKLYGKQVSGFPSAEKYFQTALTLPLYIDLDTGKISEICEVLNAL